MIDFLKKHKERVALIGVGLAFILFVVGGIYLQKKNRQEKEPLPEIAVRKVELNVRQQDEGEKLTASTRGTASFFLRPSPEEILEKLVSMENLNEDVVNSKLSNLRVMWPAYFFTLQEAENGKTTVLLDVSEDGFGVVIQSEIEIGSYPQFLKLSSGDKIWIGGEILAVDPTGTGTIHLKTEHISFGDEPPVSTTTRQAEN